MDMLYSKEKAMVHAIIPTRRKSLRTALLVIALLTLLMMFWLRGAEEEARVSAPVRYAPARHQETTDPPGPLPILPEDDPWRWHGDRIENQLQLREENLHSALIYQQVEDNSAQTMQLLQDCPVRCMMTNMDAHLEAAEALVFTPDFLDRMPLSKKNGQLWFLQLLESPINTPTLSDFNGKINYTVSYRWDADFVAPYGRFVPFEEPRRVAEIPLANKTKSVAWFVSHCLTANRRWQFAKQLAEFIEVEIFGECGDGRRPQAEMGPALRHEYKFYLAFENSNCAEYITEKLFDNALRNDVIPVVMGAPKEDYVKIAPPHSFIHVDDFEDAEQLAKYLKYLSSNSTAYQEYFNWKRLGRITDSSLPCRICIFLQKPIPKCYEDVERWWHGQHDCHNASELPPFIQ